MYGHHILFAGWFPLQTKLENAVLDNIQIHAMSVSMRVAKLDLRFSSGFAEIRSGSNVGRQSLVGKHMTIRTSVTTYRTTLVKERKERYSLHLVIKDSNAIVPSEDNNGISFPQLNGVMKDMLESSLTSIIKDILKAGNRYKLLEFDIPIPDPSKLSIVGEIIPKDIDYTFYYAGPNNRDNNFGMLFSPPNTNAKEGDEFRRFNRYELVPHDADFTFQVDSQAIMAFIDRSISEQSMFRGHDNPLYVDNTCPASVKYDTNSGVNIESMSLRKFTVKRNSSSELEIYVNLYKSRIATGVDLEAWATVRITLEYDSLAKTFKPRVTYSHQDHKTHKTWWSHLINVLSLGWFHRIVDMLTDIGVDGKIENALTVNLEGADMPLNVGGVVGDVVDRIHFSNAFIDDNGNFIFKLRIAL